MNEVLRQAAGRMFHEKYVRAALRCKGDFLRKPGFAPAYNAALWSYRAGRYQQACLWARKAETQGRGDEKTEALILGLFALQAAGSPRFARELKRLRAGAGQWCALDRFVLTCLSGDRKTAAAQIGPLLDAWSLNAPELAMVFDCLLEQGDAAGANAALRRQLEQLRDSPYNSCKGQARRMEKARFSERYRKKLISTYRFVHPLV